MSYLPCSYAVSRAPASLTMSRWMFLRVGLGEPHQLGTAAKSTDWPGVRALILKAPVPIAVSGVAHQLTGSFWTAFWSTIMPVLADREMALRNQPAGADSFTCTVDGSGADRPDIITVGSFFA